MSKKKLPQMPIVPNDDGIERHNAYHRLNPKGDKEFVVKRNGRDEETLNELSSDILGLLEYIDYGGQMTAMSPEQPPNDRALNQSPELVASSGDQIRNNDDTITNMTGSTSLAADSPETSRAKSPLQATALSDKTRNKYITGSRGVGISYGATHNESFTGTAGIAIAPMQYEVIGDDDDDDEEESTQTSESVMKRTIDDLLVEWEPEFKAGEYSPGDYQMPSPTGDGVANRKPKQNRTGAFDTDTSEIGKPFPGKHKDTAAMCDVDDNGVENKPQGGHESKHGDPNDGHQTKLGHNWPDKPKLSGGGVAEPFGGSRWSDGGTLEGGSGQDDEHYTKGSPGLPKEGPITGTKGAQMGEPMEWSPDKIGQLLGEDVDLQNLFDSYARTNDCVCLEGFQALCEAHGLDVLLDESSLLHLMNTNQEYMFHEYGDSNGSYWLCESIAECNDTRRTNKRRRIAKESTKQSFNNSSPLNEDTISELQVRSPEEEAGMYVDRYPAGDPDYAHPFSGGQYTDGPWPSADDPTGGSYDDKLRDYESDEIGGEDLDDVDEYSDKLDMSQELDHELGGGRFGGSDEGMFGQCPGCGYSGMESECPECGQIMMASESDIPDEVPQEEMPHLGIEDDDEITVSPEMTESLGKFMVSARSLLENSDGFSRKEIAEALNDSWRYYASDINANTTPTKVKGTLQQMMQRFPGFNPLLRESGSDAMCSASGKSISNTSLKKSTDLAKQPGPDEMEQHGSKDNPLNRDQKNDYKVTPIMKGTEKGLTGTGKIKEESRLLGPNAAILRENVNKLTKRIRNAIRESAKCLSGKHTVNFSIVVTEGNQKNRTPIRTQLVEAVADLEEILQFHPVDDITFETRFKNASGQVVFKSDVPLATITPRGPIVAEGRAIFRFKRNAEIFANELVSEGATCKIGPHNWGSMVLAKVTNESATTAFRNAARRKTLHA